jgi:hypothetical protein
MPETTPAERTLIGLLNRVDGDGDTVTGAAVMAGAAFARDTFQVQGMHIFKRQAYEGFAALLLHDEACRDFTNCKDEAARAVAGWLLERGDDLPHVLRQWRRIGRRQVRHRKADRQRSVASGRRGQAPVAADRPRTQRGGGEQEGLWWMIPAECAKGRGLHWVRIRVGPRASSGSCRCLPPPTWVFRSLGSLGPRPEEATRAPVVVCAGPA